MLPIAIDALGGDKAPGEIVAGAAQAARELDVPVVLVGPPDLIGDPQGLEIVPCTEVIDMHEEGAKAVRRKKDSSLVVAAELVRDGKASAMLSAVIPSPEGLAGCSPQVPPSYTDCSSGSSACT